MTVTVIVLNQMSKLKTNINEVDGDGNTALTSLFLHWGPQGVGRTPWPECQSLPSNSLNVNTPT